MVWYGWYGLVWCSRENLRSLSRTKAEIPLVWFGLVWYGLVWFGIVWYGMVWFGLMSSQKPQVSIKDQCFFVTNGVTEGGTDRPTE